MFMIPKVQDLVVSGNAMEEDLKHSAFSRSYFPIKPQTTFKNILMNVSYISIFLCYYS